MKYVLSIVMPLLLWSPANALTGNDLYDDCIRQVKTATNDLACIAYIRGVLDGFQHGRLMNSAGLSICEPLALTANQARLVIEKYLKDNPADLHIGAAALSLTALMIAYRCPKKTN